MLSFFRCSWLPDNLVGGAGFVLTRVNKEIIVAGCIGIKANSIVEAELCVMEAGLRVAEDWGVDIRFIFTDCRNLTQMLCEDSNDNNWRLRQRIANTKSRFAIDSKHAISIPRCWNRITD